MKEVFTMDFFNPRKSKLGEDGATLIEYALLAALLAVALIFAVHAFSANISNSFSQTGSALTTVGTQTDVPVDGGGGTPP